MEREDYKQLCELKERGELFSFDDITREQLKTLWLDEMVYDYLLAELFDVSKYKVAKKRKELDISIRQCVFEKMEEEVEEEHLFSDRKIKKNNTDKM